MDGKYSLKTHIHIIRYGGLYQMKNPKTHVHKGTTHITCTRTFVDTFTVISPTSIANTVEIIKPEYLECS